MDSFDPKSDDWTMYEERLEIHFLANDIPEGKKVAVMLSLIGASLYQLLRDLASPTKPSEMSYEDIIRLLRQHLSPNPRVIPERFRLIKCKQYKKESAAAFALRLKKLSQHCQFGDCLDEILRDRFISGLKCEGAQGTLLKEDDDLSFAAATDIASTCESVEREIPNTTRSTDSSPSRERQETTKCTGQEQHQRRVEQDQRQPRQSQQLNRSPRSSTPDPSTHFKRRHSSQGRNDYNTRNRFSTSQPNIPFLFGAPPVQNAYLVPPVRLVPIHVGNIIPHIKPPVRRVSTPTVRSTPPREPASNGASKSSCCRCGNSHIGVPCRLPADIICNYCKKRGHSVHACKQKPQKK